MSEFKLSTAARRKQLMKSMAPNAIAIIPSAEPKLRSRDTYFPFRQDSDFWYLSGFPEPSSVIVLIPGRDYGEAILFCQEPDPKTTLWEGAVVGPERAVSEYGFDDAFPIDDIDDILPGLVEGREHVYYSVGQRPDFDQSILGMLISLRHSAPSSRHSPGDLIDINRLLHEQRLIKDSAEIEVMRQAAHITAKGHMSAMRAAAPGRYEYQLEAALRFEFAQHGARELAYPSIVGSGANACVLHYTANDAQLKAGDLVLIDAGCEYQGYAADVTRTFPVSGRFSAQQAALYEVVLEAHEQAIAAVAVGNPWQQPHEVSVRVITQGLVDLGLLRGTVDDLIETKAYQPFYMHRVGHWLGLDVHDVGDYQQNDVWRPLQAGMVTTIEPGIYIGADCDDVAPEWRGIGIRIEDDVLVGAEGPEVLSSEAPIRISDIEHWMAS